MLYLTRKPGDAVVINENVEISVISVSGKSVKLGFLFPPEVSVLRKEVFERIQSENRSAAETAEVFTTLTLPLTPAKLPVASAESPESEIESETEADTDADDGEPRDA